MIYQHERNERRLNDTPSNTVWPLMSTAGIDIDRVSVYLYERGLSWILAEQNGWYP